jgi:cyclase
VIKKPDGRYECYTDYGRQSTGVDAFEWAIRAAELGAGELVVTSIDREGTGKGFDLELTRRVAESVPIPVIAHGGAGNVTDVIDVIKQGYADAVSIASLLHYHYVERIRQADHDFSSEGNVEFLRRGTSFSKIQPVSLPEFKMALLDSGIDCRPLQMEVV